MTITPVVRALVQAGATPEMILAAVEAAEAEIAAKAQVRREKDAERKRKSRAVSADVTRTDAESRGQGVTAQRARNPQSTTSEKTREITPPLSPPKGGHIPPSKRNPIQLPDDWEVTDDLVAYAVGLGHSPQRAVDIGEDMRVWARSKGERRADWNATYQGFARRDAKERPRSTGPPRREPDFHDIAAEARRRLDLMNEQQADDERPDTLRLVHQAH